MFNLQVHRFTAYFLIFRKFSYAPGNFTGLNFTMKIKRNSMFYDLMIIKPAVMLSVMTIFMFLMPPSATDRYSYGKQTGKSTRI